MPLLFFSAGATFHDGIINLCMTARKLGMQQADPGGSATDRKQSYVSKASRDCDIQISDTA